ncbi:hypothetical protein M0P65_05430 [Candidatus Gracilibacteria bacterium]|nr:hypothetical protein [Candidatus Gracilibacteria bacterium]
MITYNSIDYLEISLPLPWVSIEEKEKFLLQNCYERIESIKKFITKPDQSNIKSIINAIFEMRKELDSDIVKTQSIELLKIYLLIENIETQLNNIIT